MVKGRLRGLVRPAWNAHIIRKAVCDMKDENTGNGETNVDETSRDLRAFELSVEVEDACKKLEGLTVDIREAFAEKLREFDRAFRAAKVALEHSSYSVAVQLYERALASSAAIMGVAPLRDDFLTLQGEMEKAKESADSVAAEDESPEAYHVAAENQQQAISFAASKDYKMAAEHARKAVEGFSALIQAIVRVELEKANKAKVSDPLTRCLQSVEKVLRLNPENAEARALRREVFTSFITSGDDHLPGEEMTIVLPGGVPMAFCWCPATTSNDWAKISGGMTYFDMGNPKSTERFKDEDYLHGVRLTRGFWMGKYPVTQEQWTKVMGSCPDIEEKCVGYDRPVTNVSWRMCRSFLDKISFGPIWFEFPTEAQWEYACRAGTKTAYSFGLSLNGDNANCDGRIPFGTTEEGPFVGKTTPVGSYKPNAWGLCDMHGNVGEFCSDSYKKDAYGVCRKDCVLQDPSVSRREHSEFVVRGGSWRDNATFCCSYSRSSQYEAVCNSWTGFRVALVPDFCLEHLAVVNRTIETFGHYEDGKW